MARKKEAIVFIVDVGLSSGIEEIGNDNQPTTFLKQTIKCIKQVLQRKIFGELKDELALVVFATDSSENPLTEFGYENVCIKQELSLPNWDFVKTIENELKPTNLKGDFVDAIIVASDYLQTKTKEGKFAEKILYLFSPFRDPVGTDKHKDIIKALIAHGIRVNVIGPAVKDEKETPEELKMLIETKELAKLFVNETVGIWFPFKNTMDCISNILPRMPNPMPWKTNLKIGNLEIPVTSFIKVKKHQLKSWKKSYREDKTEKMLNERTFHKFDEVQTQCEKEEIVERYKYGSTLVIYTEEDKANMDYKSGDKCLSVLGFTKSQNIKRHHFLGDGVHYVVADQKHREYEKAGASLSAFIHALYELDMVAIARKVYSIRSSPIIGCLMPLIKNEYESLTFVQLPFMEDLRLYTFPTLNMTNIDKDGLDLIDNLIDNLSPDVKSKKSGLLKKMDNPNNRRLFECYTQRILNPTEPIKEPEMPSLFTLSKEKN